ncbi:MAG TPA: formylglycine-generating enzyme family protein [Vicinamibacterales bacterium]|nr:formylglycine-generating enzyme family protein [Vicinamibacterales bacterium]
MRRAVLIAIGLGAVLVHAAADKPAERVPLDVVLDRAAWYLDYFIDQFVNVVAEETYIQDSNQPLPSFSPFVGRGGIATAPPSAADIARARHRDLRSDFLLVKSPESENLIPFRDVIEVDGVPVRDRQERLAKLFGLRGDGAPGVITKDALTQAEAIRDEGVRYNLGSMRSTIGNPVLALGVMQASYQQRFKFSLGKEDRTVGPGIWWVDYHEVSSPAMIKGEAGVDLFAHGRIWIEVATGRVLKTELHVEQPAVRAVVTTTFRFDDRFTIAVPQEMREQYTLGTGNAVRTIASYGRFRRFDVKADEEVHLPTRTITDVLTGMTFVDVPAGRFTMGSAASEAQRQDDETLHDVEITHAFYLARTETTQTAWRRIMGTTPSTFANCGPQCPVENVTYFDVEQFLEKLNERGNGNRADKAARPDGPALHYRLPTEAEWEYACRAGTTGPFSTGESLTSAQANFKGKSPSPVGTYPLNPWGFADMHGNVWEWTSDWYAPYPERTSANIDPHGPASGEKRVIRGGSWYFDSDSARCALRYTHAPKDKGFSLGFRVAADPR